MEFNEVSFIKIPYPTNAKDLTFKITAPICPLDISPGIGNSWATGRYNDPKTVMPLIIKQSGNFAEIIAQGAFGFRTPPEYYPHLKLSFGRSKPFSLSIKAGEINNQLDFGGLPLSSLAIQYGDSNQVIDFSYPNPKEMKRMTLLTDAGRIRIENFANANAAEIQLNGESTSYQLNFGCELRRNTVLNIYMASRVKISIPASTAVKTKSANPPITSDKDDFSYQDKHFWNSLAMDHQEPLLFINNPAGASLHIQYF